MMFSRCESLHSTHSECSSTSGQERVPTAVTKGWDGDFSWGHCGFPAMDRGRSQKQSGHI